MLPVKKYERKTNSILLLQVYAKYNKEFLNPGVNKQEVWRKIAHEMKDKGYFNYDELQWCRKVKELRREYEKNKYMPATSGEMVDFKIAAKNAFQTIENPVPVNYPAPETSSMIRLKKHERRMENVLLLQVYGKYKRVLLTPGVNKQEVWRKIACEMTAKGSFNYDRSHWCRKVQKLRKKYERIKYIPATATNGEMVNFKIAAKNAFQTIENPEKILKVNCSSKDHRKSSAKHQVAAAPNKVKMTPQMKKQFIKDRHFERNTVLLTVYTLHKDEFSIHVNGESVWKKIADKVNEKFPNFKCRPGQCLSKVHSMKKRYECIKDKNSEEITSTNDAIFLKEAKLAFETKENPVTFIDDQRRQKLLASLEIFNMYKSQFLSPDANPQELWQKMTETANKLSLKNKPYCVGDFRNHMRSQKTKYDKLKYSNTDIATPEDAIFFEKAKLVFESTGSEAIPVDQILHDGLSVKVKRMSERDLALLRAYNIYKAEFSSPNEDDESVWEKIAGTVRISCSFNRLSINDCRLKLSYMKEKYEKKKQGGNFASRPEEDILFEEEKLAFETVEYPEEHEQMDLLTEISTDSALC